MRHIRVHTSLKPYKCIQCDYKSYKGGNIVLHARKVHGRQGTMKDVVTLQDEKAAMDTMVENILKRGKTNKDPIFHQMQPSIDTAKTTKASADRSLVIKNDMF